MPNWKYPCLKCFKPVKNNQKGLECNTCIKWVHFKCTNLTDTQYNYLEENNEIPYYCYVCNPEWVCIIPENPTTPSPFPLPNIDTSLKSSFDPISFASQNNLTSILPENNPNSTFDSLSAHSSDFEYIDDSDSESRGLNFKSLPVQHTSNYKKKVPASKFKFARTINYKFPCLVCLSPCKENIHDSICCTLCDEWVHRKCTDLTPNQFKTYCSPDHAGDPYYCVNCLYGNCSKQNFDSQICLNASEIESFDLNDIDNLCPNSVFKDKEDTVQLSEYLTMEELNVEIQKTPDDILLIHINAVSLCKNIEAITDSLAELKKQPSILFISETKVQDAKLKTQKPQIQIEGYTFVLHNSPTDAGGTAIYVSDGLKYNPTEIKFNYPNCEACFIEIVSDTPGQNPIFGALYRHPGHNARSFCVYLGEFLENFAQRGTKITILGDINIDLNKSNVIAHEYMNTLTALGFSTLINQPTRIFHYEGSNIVSCSTLDHLITNSSSNFTKAGILIADVSDHLPIFGLMTLSKPCSNCLKNTYRRFFCESKKDKFLNCLSDRLRNIDLNLDPNLLMDKIFLLTKDAINVTFPLKKFLEKNHS